MKFIKVQVWIFFLSFYLVLLTKAIPEEISSTEQSLTQSPTQFIQSTELSIPTSINSESFPPEISSFIASVSSNSAILIGTVSSNQTFSTPSPLSSMASFPIKY
ncbi:hypothetical protein Glove_156g53 [Diversispora epigaea]|uniref:REJ domain-containing protein n=1 Tax=Diversispora epigaea TaxID=1348612 RepID=A0A397IYA0_9GLOM|nr:hypothetical protein Glove_156g53 [Diversispora epigaea]